MTLVLISNNLGIMWVGIEATTLLTAFLICIPVKPASLEAMWKYLMICSIGVAFAFLGTLMVAASASGLHLNPSDTLLWTKLRQRAASLNPMLLKTGFLCLLVGYGTKAGLAPDAQLAAGCAQPGSGPRIGHFLGIHAQCSPVLRDAIRSDR